MSDEYAERRETARAATRTALVAILAERGPMTDQELFRRYLIVNEAGALPAQSRDAIIDRRRELFAEGRVAIKGRSGRRPLWGLT